METVAFMKIKKTIVNMPGHSSASRKKALLHRSVLAGLIVGLFSLFMFKPIFAFDHSYAGYDKLLREIVVVNGPQSSVRYDNIQKNPELLDRFVQEIEAVSRPEYDGWSDDQKKAFLINAYNALTIKLILTKYPDLKSIKDLGGFFSSPWKKKFFTLFGEKQYLDHIEHEVLRENYAEPRFHFVLVCASIGCPALKAEAYVADRLDQQLEDAKKGFLSDSTRNRFNKKENQLEVSSIFKWYKQDFVKSKGSIEAYVAPSITTNRSDQKRIKSGDVDLVFLDYDWNLNKAEN